MRNAHAHALFAFAALLTSGCWAGPQSSGCHTYAARQEQGVAPEQVSAGSEQIDPSLFVGTWTGRGCQSDGPCWTIRVNIEADEAGMPTGSIAYPSVPCEARLEFVQWEVGDVAAFRERFADHGRCIPDGWLRLRLLGTERLGFEWSYPDGRVDAGTTLDRAR